MSGSYDPPLERLRARDAEALTHIVTSHARSIYRAALALGFTDDVAQDLTQDVFITFLETLDRFEGRSQVRTWLLGILYRKGQERRRLMYREETLDPADPVFESWFTERGLWVQHPKDPTELFDDEGAMQAISDCLAKLPELHRSVFQLREVEELSAAEVSDVLGESVNHIGVLLHRARTRLRDCLTKKGRIVR